MNTNRTASEFAPIEDQIVCFRAHSAQVAGLEFFQIFIDRRGERMVHGIPAFVLFVVLEHWKIYNPEQSVLALVDQTFTAADFEPDLAERIGDRIPFAADHQNGITRSCAGPFDDSIDPLSAHEFFERRFSLSFLYL